MSIDPHIDFGSSGRSRLDQEIEDVKLQIEKHEKTIAELKEGGHETADASKHLVELLDLLSSLVQQKARQ